MDCLYADTAGSCRKKVEDERMLNWSKARQSSPKSKTYFHALANAYR